MRSKAIEIEIDIELIHQEVLDSGVLDIEYSARGMSTPVEVAEDEVVERVGCNILWIHSDGFKPFLDEYFQYLTAVISVYNRATKTDHLNLYIEDIDAEESEYNYTDQEGITYRNVRFSELGEVNLAEVKFRRELENEINE